MGFSTPKTPFNLADFLSQKGAPRTSRKPSWKRSPQPRDAEADPSQDGAAESTTPDETGAE